MDRRQFLRRSLTAAGSAAIVGKVAWPAPSLALPRVGGVYSPDPCRYSIRGLQQDCSNSGGMALGNPVFAPQGDNYRIRLHWKALSIDVPTPYNALGGMTFRGGDDQNYYYLVFFLDHVGIARINNNVGTEVATAPRPVDISHHARFTLLMQRNRFLLKDNAVSGSPVILDWTDDLNVAPYGNHVDHWTRGGVKGRWEFAIGRPLGVPSAVPKRQAMQIARAPRGIPVARHRVRGR